METSSVQLKLANQSVAPLRSRLPTPAVWCVKVVQLLPAVKKKTKKRVSFQLGLEYFVVLGLSERMADLFPVLKSAQMQSLCSILVSCRCCNDVDLKFTHRFL